jgi:integrase
VERKRTTIADYRGYLRKHLAPFFGGRPLDRIECVRDESYLLVKKRDGLSAKTIQNHLNFLNGIFAFAIKREWATANPVSLVDRPKAPRAAHRRLRFLSKEELAAVIRAIPDDELSFVERPLYLCAAMTGLRQGELLVLRWCDVDWIAGCVRIAESYTRGVFDSPKSHRGRSGSMSDRLAGELEHHFQRTRWRGERDLVFAHPLTRHVLDASKLRKRFRAAVAPRRRSGPHVPRVARHVRHAHGNCGAPLRSIQAWVGHPDASTTEISSHYAPDLEVHEVAVSREDLCPRFNGVICTAARDQGEVE